MQQNLLEDSEADPEGPIGSLGELDPQSVIAGNSHAGSQPTNGGQASAVQQPTATLRVDPDGFPDQPTRGSNQIPGTLENVRHLLRAANIVARYNVISKRLEVIIPKLESTLDNRDGAAMTRVISLASANGLAIGHVPEYVAAIGDENAYNPVADWIKSKPWDGEDRLDPFYTTVMVAEEYPVELKETLLRKWLLSAVAAALLPNGFKTRGVLTLQGPQGIGKTSWTKRLVSEPGLREDVVKVDHLMDATNKDSILGAISHWIVEIGELDASFKRDISRLKGFLTADTDKIRQPYARAASDYQRRTVFVATVNEQNFLIDPTGNSRFWTLSVIALWHDHSIDMQQLYAQLAVDLEAGAEWWLTKAEERELAKVNAQHGSLNAVEERIRERLDLSRVGQSGGQRFTAIQLLRHIGIENPTNQMCKDCAATLRNLLGQPKRIQGSMMWCVHLQEEPKNPNTIPLNPKDDDRF